MMMMEHDRLNLLVVVPDKQCVVIGLPHDHLLWMSEGGRTLPIQHGYAKTAVLHGGGKACTNNDGEENT